LAKARIELDNPENQSTEVEALAKLCRKILDENAWADAGAANAARFHDVMDVRKVCRPVIDRTLAALA
jgi:hypothetical protein